MMKIALLLPFVAALVQDDKPLFPAEAGASWTYRETLRDVKSEFSLKPGEVGSEKLELVEADKEATTRKPVPGKGVLILRRDGAILWLVEQTDQEVRIYSRLFQDMFGIHWTVKASLKDGLTWKASQVFMSCGFGTAEEEYKATAEKVTVPAGTYEAIRIDIGANGQPRGSIWVARGVGIVKSKEGDHLLELIKFEPK